MIKESDFIGLPILENGNKNCNFKAKNIVYSLNNIYISGIGLQCTNSDKDTAFIEYKKIKDITNDGILIGTINSILKEEQVLGKGYIGESAIGCQIYSDNNNIIGLVKDLLIERKNGRILGLIISEGLAEDLINGYSFLPLSEDIKFDNYNIILKNENILNILPQRGGLKKLLGIDLKN